MVEDDEEEEEEGLVGEEEVNEEDIGQPSDDVQQLRQRKDELTQKHLDRQHRKQQLNVSGAFICLQMPFYL